MSAEWVVHSALNRQSAAEQGRWVGMARRDLRERGNHRRLAVPAAIALFVLYSATSVLTGRYERLLFGVIVVVTAFVALGSRSRAVPRGISTLVAGWLVTVVLYFVASFLQLSWSPYYVVGDVFLALLPLLMILAFLAEDVPLSSRAPLILLIATTAVAACEAQFLGTLHHRHDPPSPFLIAAAWYYLLAGKTRTIQMLGFALVCATGYFTFTSGYRTHLLLWAVAPTLILLVLRGIRGVLFTLAMLSVVFFSLFLSGHPFELSQSLDDTRFETVVNNQADVSIDTRFDEVNDVFWTIRREWMPGQQVMGYGFGASYEPHVSDITRDVGDDGRVHNIHIGPVLVFYRYGLIGLGIMVVLVAFIVRMLFRLRVNAYPARDFDTYAVMNFAAVLFLIEFLTLNSSVEPLMSYSLAGLIVIALLGRGHPEESGNGGALVGGEPKAGNHA